jgi:hypothetical protein
VALSGALGRSSFGDLAELLEAIPQEVNRLAATTDLGIALHAGAVRSPEGVVVALVGESGAGKSTLVATLVRAGWQYVTDEALAVRPGSLQAVAYPKPLALGAESRGVLGLPDQGGELVTADSLRPGAAVPPGDAGPLGALVLARYEAGAGTELTALRPVEALAGLAGSVLNLHVVGVDGFRSLLDLVARIPCHRLVHGGGSDVVSTVTVLALARGADRPIPG